MSILINYGEKSSFTNYRKVGNLRIERNLNASQQRIANHFSAFRKKTVNRRCIGDILMNAEKWINANDLHSNVKGLKPANYEVLDDALCKQMSAKMLLKLEKSSEITQKSLSRKWTLQILNAVAVGLADLKSNKDFLSDWKIGKTKTLLKF